jgi:hypothetical protein
MHFYLCAYTTEAIKAISGIDNLEKPSLNTILMLFKLKNMPVLTNKSKTRISYRSKINCLHKRNRSLESSTSQTETNHTRIRIYTSQYGNENCMESISSFETSFNIYQTTRCNIPGDSHLHTRRRENLKPYRHRI